ncbi:MAG: Glutamate-tRNA ligase [Candidatus Moranbacteria bacterium GW2011_GWF2_36_839]|nr:MAG: Glutamate-tRNA ligase [Candidatus Moranbacteria bacterium GW2011_GWF1_36_78]KKQ17729.1 MAG: Glutamate-tRNA ligase [Candidatus Moranbacteria bacterium GW2011_GWF2_36_839]HAT73431.1 glutamate--tRNA ligase [Candidatus Moranbacteria bacterium]HBY10794.1 glutamate--tRNA ligase [Candidatus Moranbacteria bacterium]
MNKIRTRFAPSPTGYLHVGGLRTALYAYLFAKKNSGDFLLKIEDTDRKRFVEGAVEKLINSLDFLGLERNEGVMLSKVLSNNANSQESKNYPGVFEVGEYGPYIQSEKLEIYKKYADGLVKNGYAYYCFCEPERLEEMRKEQTAKKQPPIYDRFCLQNVSEEEINKNLKNNCPYTIRIKVPQDETIEVDDVIRGRVKFNTNLVTDQILLKSDGFPTYHLASVIDDHDMQTTHVIRGEEWLPSMPIHILLYRYFGWEAPKFAHLPLLLNPDKSKLSKRQGDVAVEDYIKKGYLKEAIINFVAMLGWNPGKGETQEIFTLDELVEKFDLAHVHKAGAVFDIKKLDWINSQWIKKLSIEELYEKSLEFFKEKEFYKNTSAEKKSDEYIKKVLSIEQDRLQNLSEVGESNQFFFHDANFDKELLRWKDMSDDDLKKSLEKSLNVLENITDENWTRENLEKILMESAGENRGELLWPLRATLTGEKKSPSPFECAWVLGKEETSSRLKNTIGKI